MVEIIHLAPGERAPRGKLVIECSRKGEELGEDARGITWRIRPEDLDTAIERLAQKGAKTIYVRGAPRA